MSDEEQSPEVEEQEEEYTVEKVVDKRTVKGKIEYLLKWKGSVLRISFRSSLAAFRVPAQATKLYFLDEPRL